MISRKPSFFASSFMSSLLLCTSVVGQTVTIPTNTQIYVSTDEPVSGKKKHTQNGQVVRASVWRDVIVDKQIVIEAGTPVLVRVDKIKGANIAGIKGKLTLGAYDTTAVDGTTIDLSGGYLKEGKGRIALTATLAAVVFLPLIFIKGKSANLDRGTVFDAYTKRKVTINGDGSAPAQALNLSGVLDQGLEVEVLYDELQATDKPEIFAFAITAPSGLSGDFFIDVVNDEPIKERLELESKKTTEGTREVWRGEIKIKKLGESFKKGINTFEIATNIDGERVGEEVLLDIQM